MDQIGWIRTKHVLLNCIHIRHTYAQIKKLDAQLRDANTFWSSQRRWLFKRHLWLVKELRRLLSLKSSGAAEAIFAPRTY